MKCPKCKIELGDLFVFTDGEFKISGKVAFHLWDTHGIPVEMTEAIINGKA